MMRTDLCIYLTICAICLPLPRLFITDQAKYLGT